jgi:glycosyltransferase involved in cell wall biosynthesis
MDLLVHLSRREGLPRALPQALAASKPVIAYDIDGAREVCLDGQTGFLVRPGDLAALQRRIVELGSNAPLRTIMGRRGRSFVRNAFGIEPMVDALYALYRRLLSQRSG